MTILSKLIAGSFAALALTGCTTARTPLVAVAVDSVGVTLGAGAQSQGGNLTVGFKGAKFAVVPVQTHTGDRLVLKSGDQEKSFSVFAALGVDAKGGLGPGVDIRQVVAVGPAAEIWAAGTSGVSAADLRAATEAVIIQR